MKVESTRFGMIEVPEEQVIEFPHGIPGFEHAKRFFLMNHEASAHVKWLHGIDMPDLALAMTDPFGLCQGYAPELPDEAVEELGIESPDDMLLLAVLSVRSDRNSALQVTANLMAPVVISLKRRLGMQVTLYNTDYPLRYAVQLSGRAASDGRS